MQAAKAAAINTYKSIMKAADLTNKFTPQQIDAFPFILANTATQLGWKKIGQGSGTDKKTYDIYENNKSDQRYQEPFYKAIPNAL